MEKLKENKSNKNDDELIDYYDFDSIVKDEKYRNTRFELWKKSPSNSFPFWFLYGERVNGVTIQARCKEIFPTQEEAEIYLKREIGDFTKVPFVK